jgi:hypothetical protein
MRRDRGHRGRNTSVGSCLLKAERACDLRPRDAQSAELSPATARFRPYLKLAPPSWRPRCRLEAGATPQMRTSTRPENRRTNPVKMSVAYGNQIAGVEGVELSLGKITQSSNTICGRRADSRVNLVGVASAAQYWLFGRNGRLNPCREPRAHCSSSKATMFMEKSTVTGRTRENPGEERNSNY